MDAPAFDLEAIAEEVRSTRETADLIARERTPAGPDADRVLAGLITHLCDQLERLCEQVEVLTGLASQSPGLHLHGLRVVGGPGEWAAQCPPIDKRKTSRRAQLPPNPVVRSMPNRLADGYRLAILPPGATKPGATRTARPSSRRGPPLRTAPRLRPPGTRRATLPRR